MWRRSINTSLCIDVIFQDHMMDIIGDDCAMQTATLDEGCTKAAASNPRCGLTTEGERS
jgi:hypothetical protein